MNWTWGGPKANKNSNQPFKHLSSATAMISVHDDSAVTSGGQQATAAKSPAKHVAYCLEKRSTCWEFWSACPKEFSFEYPFTKHALPTSHSICNFVCGRDIVANKPKSRLRWRCNSGSFSLESAGALSAKRGVVVGTMLHVTATPTVGSRDPSWFRQHRERVNASAMKTACMDGCSCKNAGFNIWVAQLPVLTGPLVFFFKRLCRSWPSTITKGWWPIWVSPLQNICQLVLLNLLTCGLDLFPTFPHQSHLFQQVSPCFGHSRLTKTRTQANLHDNPICTLILIRGLDFTIVLGAPHPHLWRWTSHSYMGGSIVMGVPKNSKMDGL